MNRPDFYKWLQASGVLLRNAVQNLAVGIGIAPSAWSGTAVSEFQLSGNQGFVGAFPGGLFIVGKNCYFNGTNVLYKANGIASFIMQDASGTLSYVSAVAGTAGGIVPYGSSIVFSVNPSGVISTTQGTMGTAAYQGGWATTATAGATTTLTSASAYTQTFTGTLAQTVQLPDATTLLIGQGFRIENKSTLAVSVVDAASGAIWTVAAGTNLVVVCATHATAAGTWEVFYNGNVTATGKVLTANNSVILAGADGATYTLPAASASVGYINIPQNSQSANYTTVAADAGKHVYHPSTDANARTFTIDSNANVPYAIGTAITFVNMSANAVTIAITSDTLYFTGVGSTGSRTLAQYGEATAIKLTATTWMISGAGLT